MRNPSHGSRIRAIDYHSGPARKSAWLAVLLGLVAVPCLQATVLDNFIGPKTGWTDTLNGGSVLQSGGEFTVTTANPAGSLTYSKKTSSSFTNAAGHTLEFRVNLDSVTPGNANTNPLAILAWVPSGGAVLASGYSISVGAADVLIQKGGTTLYATNFTAAGTNLQNANITMALRMTSSGSAVTVNARVYKRIASGQIGQYFTTLFEYTVVDSSGLIGGTGGNAALGVKNQASASGVAAAFSNLQVFDTITSVLDTFSSGTLDTTKWTVYKKNAGLGDSVTVGPSGLDILATIADASGGFAAVYSANTTYKIVDGGQVEFQLDIINNLTGGKNGYSALGYLPAANPTYINGIIEYHVAHDIIGTTTVVNGKGYNEWWGGRNDIQPPYAPPGCRYILTMTGEGSNCRVETRIEDLNVADVNDPARLVWQTEFVDTPAADPGLNEASLGNPAPYLNSPDGRFAISTFNANAVPFGFPGGNSANWAEAIYSNAVVRQTLPGKTAPILANVVPAYSANFLPSSNVVSFDASDAANLPLSGLSITLNGVTYANGSPGVTITPSGSTSTTRHFALASALTANVNYVGGVQATNSNGLSATFPLVFDTFLTNDYVIEAEEFNFSTNGGVSGGGFIDNPALVPDGNPDPNAYNGQPGLAEVDYHDNRGPWTGVQDANHTFRWYDSVYTSHSSDPARAKYVNSGGIASGFYETEVTDIHDGDWVNYTHTYPAGTYNVFLRQATFKVLGSLVTLERVTSDPTTTGQTTSVLGSFLGTPTGIGLFINVPLTDGVGNSNVVLRFSGSQDTLRVMNRVTGNANLDVGSLEQNYLVLVPVANPGTLRPVVSMVSPAPGDIVGAGAPNTGASIINRDTTVNISTLALTINGVSVPISGLVSNADGINFTWVPAGLPPSLALTNTISFKDSAGVQQSFTWAYSYASVLNASAALPVGSLSVRGFDARMVQSSAANMSGGGLNNSVASARTVLAIPPTYAVDLTSTSIVQTVAWDLNPPGGYGATANFPGLCQPPAVVNSFAVETFAYLQFSAGPHRMSVDSDDAVGIYSGANLADSSIALVENNGTTHTSFDFYAPVDGLYPFHVIYQQGGGSAVLVLKSLDGGTTNLVNVAGGVNAYYPFVCKSSTSVAGTYTVDAAANAGNVITTADVPCDGTGTALNQTLTGGTLTIPIAGSAKFYRLDGPRPSNITSITKSGSNVVIIYQAQ